MPYAYPGNPELGHVIADVANEMGVKSRAHSVIPLTRRRFFSVVLRPTSGSSLGACRSEKAFEHADAKPDLHRRRRSGRPVVTCHVVADSWF